MATVSRGRRSRRRDARPGLLLAAVVLGALPSCSAGVEVAPALTDGAVIDVASAVLAVTINPQSNNFTGSGSLMLVDVEGDQRSYSHGGLDAGAVLWSRSGIFLSDVQQDYLLTDTVDVSSADRANLSIGAVELGSGAFVQISNDGFTDSGGYTNDVVIRRNGGSTASSLEGYVWQLADCGASAIAVVETEGPLATGDVVNPTVFTAHRLDLGAGDRFVPVAEFSFTGELAQNPGIAECVNDTLVWLSRTVDTRLVEGASGLPDGSSGAAVVEWDVGQPSAAVIRPLIDPLGPVAPELVDASQAGTGAAEGPVLRWFAADGSVRETERATGATVSRGALADPAAGGGGDPIGVGGLTRFDGDCLWILDIPPSGDVRLLAHDLRADLTREVVSIDGLADSLSVNRVLRGFAVNPTLRC